MTTVQDRPPAPETVLRTEMVPDVTPPPIETAFHAAWHRWLGWIMIAIAFVAAWALVYLLVLSPFAEARAQKGLYARLRSELASGTAPVAEPDCGTPCGHAIPVSVGAPIALIDIPKAGVHHLVVVEGTAPAQLEDGPGHLRSTSLPGQVGISVVMGRSLSYGGVFGGIHRLQPGDDILVTTGQGRFRYRVADAPHGSGTLKVPDTTTAMLTLATSNGSGWLGGLRSSSAIYVDAVLTGTPQPRAGTPPAASDREQPMHGDYTFTTIAQLVLSLQLLVIVIVGIAWARRHWSRTMAQVLGIPVALAALWLVTGVAVQLLPNLM